MSGAGYGRNVRLAHSYAHEMGADVERSGQRLKILSRKLATDGKLIGGKGILIPHDLMIEIIKFGDYNAGIMGKPKRVGRYGLAHLIAETAQRLAFIFVR